MLYFDDCWEENNRIGFDYIDTSSQMKGSLYFDEIMEKHKDFIGFKIDNGKISLTNNYYLTQLISEITWPDKYWKLPETLFQLEALNNDEDISSHINMFQNKLLNINANEDYYAVVKSIDNNLDYFSLPEIILIYAAYLDEIGQDSFNKLISWNNDMCMGKQSKGNIVLASNDGKHLRKYFFDTEKCTIGEKVVIRHIDTEE